MTIRHYFSGTRALHSIHSHLYAPNNTPLMDQIDRTRITPPELAKLALVEQQILTDKCPYVVFNKGYVRLTVDPRTHQVVRMHWDWKLTSFKAYTVGND
jgi:hypothetical protein